MRGELGGRGVEEKEKGECRSEGRLLVREGERESEKFRGGYRQGAIEREIEMVKDRVREGGRGSKGETEIVLPLCGGGGDRASSRNLH